MDFKIKYRKLFEVQILHDYYRNNGTTEFEQLNEREKALILKRYDISQDLTIVPTPECHAQLKNYGLIFKKSTTGFLLAAKVKEIDDSTPHGYQPFVPFAKRLKLSFAIYVKNTLFLNFSSLPPARAGNNMYYFSNLAGRQGSTFPALALPLPDFRTGTTYEAGDLIMQGNNLFEAITETKRRPSNTVKDWNGVTVRPYACSQDRITVQTGIYNYTFSKENTSTQILFTVTDLAIAEEEKPEVFKESVTSSVPLKQYQIDLRDLAPGIYQLNVKGNNGYSGTVDFYLYHASAGANSVPFALFEIFYLPSEHLGGYELLNEEGGKRLMSPVYEIFLKNRSTFWRYIFSKDQIVNDNDLGQLKREAPNEKRRFTSKEVLPLTFGFEEIKKFKTAESLPNPSVNLIRPENKKVYSDMYINS